MINKQTFVNLCYIYLILITANSVDAAVKYCTSQRGCPNPNEFCLIQTQQCQCKEGTTRFAGNCVGRSEYGEKCQTQYECSQSGDGHLHCTDQICKCGNQRIYDQKTKKCERITMTSQSNYHLKKMTPNQPHKNVVELDDKYKDIKHVG